MGANSIPRGYMPGKWQRLILKTDIVEQKFVKYVARAMDDATWGVEVKTP